MITPNKALLFNSPNVSVDGVGDESEVTTVKVPSPFF